MSWEDLHGWFDFPDVYDAAVAAAKDGDAIVEVGVSSGRSLAYLARAVIDSGKRIDIYGVDMWIDPTWEEFAAGMRKHAPEEFQRVRPIIADSADASARFQDASLAFVFLDADHSYEGVKRDIAAWLPKVRPGGMLAGHDYNGPEGVRRAVEEAFGACPIGVTGSCWGVRR